ncbi:YggS family pyridoxal phosphate-dependent enzyme [Exiguobacterium sp. AM39-5BH]|uniref:YggS family pyridoxal phosphate-dependent enzyme n=1 Tax=Exiguobacterium sp. AM39-5BH TaxID=2292355 RepID=UPI000FE1B39E|nr:YggS family pyridoxal phosphate-dependent enzyme [Exiguobacterium sp. AM39-5BH]RHB51199.1 YggS family pyridoxal phosphate-dependent enzyme [Exiguobacterium sp. AM39-5BH]
MSIANNVNKVRQTIDAHRTNQSVTLIAVTKSVGPDVANALYEEGIRDFGENRPEGLLEKVNYLPTDAKFHFIGTLQTRKVRQIVDHVVAIHSLDRLSLAEEIDKRANRVIDCFVQVNVSGEGSKHGLEKEEVIPFIENCKQYPHVRIIGLMTMAPFTEDETVIRETFRNLRQLRDDVARRAYPHAPCTELSMGMSNDYTSAIEEGASFVRIGTVLVQ